MSDVALLAIMIANAAKVVAVSYLVGYFTIHVMDFGGIFMVFIILLIILLFITALLLKQLMENRKKKP